jgi:glucose/mannose transport system permease protein
MAQVADIEFPPGQLMRPTWERVFIWGVSVALVWRMASMIGLLNFLDDDGGVGTALLTWVSWAGLGVSALAVAAILFGSGRDGTLREHRVWPHSIWWGVAALVLVVLTIHSIGISSLKTISESSPGLASYLGGVDWLFDQLGKTGGILVKLFTGHGAFIAAFLALVSAMLAVIGMVDATSAKPGAIQRIFVSNIVAKIAAVPMAIVAVGVFVGATLWTVYHSFTESRLLPKSEFIGTDQYERLWDPQNSVWWTAISNLGIYAVVTMTFSLTIGFLLAVLLDQKIRFENTFRTILLYPFALSFIVTGLIWQWLLNPDLGFLHVMRSIGWESFTFDPLFNPDIVILGICIAGLWHGTGLIMCLMLAGLRGIDEEIWKAARVDGIPTWKTYLRIVIPMMRPVFITTIVLIASGILRVYDLVVAQTSGGPGIASAVPAKYVYDYMFGAQNLAQGFAASTMMLVAVVIIVIPWAILEFGNRKHG